MLYNYILDVNYYDKNNILRNKQFECKENLNLNAMIYYINNHFNVKNIKIKYKKNNNIEMLYFKFTLYYILFFIIFMTGIFLIYG